MTATVAGPALRDAGEPAARWRFEGLQGFGYDVADVDPPWPNENFSPKGEKKSSVAKYGRMRWEEIEALPVGDLLKRDGLVRLWCTWPLLLHGGDVKRHYKGHDAGVSKPGRCLRAWGLRYVTGGAWFKRTASGAVSMGPGYRLRTVCEPFLIGVTGAPQTVRLKNAIESLLDETWETVFDNAFDGVRREHSRKPEEGYDWLERLMPQARRCTLFAPPEPRPGWDVWGFAHGVYRPVVHLDGARAAA